MEGKVSFYNLHPGINGEFTSIPQPIRQIVGELNGKEMLLEDAVEKLCLEVKKIRGKIIISEKEKYLGLEFKKGDWQHFYKLLFYK
ncbi:hypothetical protein HY643_04210 [Candidatus Woesearchaeota archaeon]|nr:hypothetical protein [Candidatus Woesearchaeota archaeon]